MTAEAICLVSYMIFYVLGCKQLLTVKIRSYFGDPFQMGFYEPSYRTF